MQDEFVTTACLCYDDPHYDHRSFQARATQMLSDNPGLAQADIWSAAASGNVEAVTAFLEAETNSVNQPGPHNWTPLLCACYSRVNDTLAVAKLLLERGADPNAYTLKGNADERLSQKPRRFTALTGVFGGGSTGLANQPPHPHWRELAELLLHHGANPADEMALSINQDASLEILLNHGLTTLLGRALARAALHGNIEQVHLLLAHKAPTGELFRGKTPWQHAMSRGHLEIARTLENAGAPVSKLNDVDQFVSLCLAAEEAAVRNMLARTPDLLERAPKSLVLKATNTGRTIALRLVLDLGFDPNFLDEVTALHSAAGANNEEMVRLLLERGASPTIREPFYHATPIAWAQFFDQTHIVNLLLNESPTTALTPPTGKPR